MNKQKALKLLNETAQHYNINNRCVTETDCLYIPKEGMNSGGCAIGRVLPKWAKKEILNKDINRGTGVKYMLPKLSKIPRSLTGLDVTFLEDIQNLHDNCGYWVETGLSEFGKMQVNDIKGRWNL